jgi:hypothetical protein
MVNHEVAVLELKLAADRGKLSVLLHSDNKLISLHLPLKVGGMATSQR